MLLSQTLVKATRTEHQCHGCLDMIPIGSRAQKDAGVAYGGQFWAIVWCVACADWLKEHPDFWEDFPDGCMPGDVGESRNQEAMHA